MKKKRKIITKILVILVSCWIGLIVLFTILSLCNIYSTNNFLKNAFGFLLPKETTETITEQKISEGRTLITCKIENERTGEKGICFLLKKDLPLSFYQIIQIQEEDFTPYNIDDATIGLLQFLDENEISRVKNQHLCAIEDDLHDPARILILHWIKNPQNRKLYQFFIDQGIDHQEDMLSIVLWSLYEKSNGEKIDQNNLIGFFINYRKNRPAKIVSDKDVDEIVKVVLMNHFLPYPAILPDETYPISYHEVPNGGSYAGTYPYFRRDFDRLIQSELVDSAEVSFMIQSIDSSKVYSMSSKLTIPMLKLSKLWINRKEAATYLKDTYGTSGMVEIKTPIFNQDSTKAIIELSQSGYGDGAGYCFVMKKTDGIWRIIDIYTTWIS